MRFQSSLQIAGIVCCFSTDCFVAHYAAHLQIAGIVCFFSTPQSEDSNPSHLQIAGIVCCFSTHVLYLVDSTRNIVIFLRKKPPRP